MSFVRESIEQGVLLDVSDYLFEDIELVVKGKTPKAVAAARKSSDTHAKRQTGKHTTPRHSQDSPSPPPQSARGEKYSKGYSYSEMERQYVSTYLPFVFAKDHLISNAEIAQRLYKKVI